MSALEIVGLEWLGALALFLGFILLIRYLDHRERMAMIDRGLMPPERLLPAGHRGSALLRGGLITASVGVAVTIGLYTLGYLLPPPLNAVPGRLGPWLLPGLIPLLVGAALVASHYLAPPQATSDEQHGDQDSQKTGQSSARASAASGPLARIIPWRLFGRSEPLALSARREVAAGDDTPDDVPDDDVPDDDGALRRHG